MCFAFLCASKLIAPTPQYASTRVLHLSILLTAILYISCACTTFSWKNDSGAKDNVISPIFTGIVSSPASLCTALPKIATAFLSVLIDWNTPVIPSIDMISSTSSFCTLSFPVTSVHCILPSMTRNTR